METTTSHGRMSNQCNCDYCIESHGKKATTEQHKKRIKKHKHYCAKDPEKVLRWNKKNGNLELSKKGSRLERWFY